MLSRFPLATAVLLFAGNACSGDQNHGKVPADLDACVALVADYVTTTRSWSRESYTIREEGAESPDGRGFSVWHVSDNVRMRPPGGQGKSFHVEVDARCSRVTTELRYQ